MSVEREKSNKNPAGRGQYFVEATKAKGWGAHLKLRNQGFSHNAWHLPPFAQFLDIRRTLVLHS